MIHMLQVLCGPKRHAIWAVLYDDKAVSVEDARIGTEAQLENLIAMGIVRRRCEICDAPVHQFVYEDRVYTEQDWEKAKAIGKRLEAEQTQTRETVQALRRAEKN